MEDVVYLRDLDGSGSMHVCAKGDSGAEPYVRDGLFSGVYAVALADQMECRRKVADLEAQLVARDAEIVAYLRREADGWEACGDTLAAFAIREAILTLAENGCG